MVLVFCVSIEMKLCAFFLLDECISCQCGAQLVYHINHIYSNLTRTFFFFFR